MSADFGVADCSNDSAVPQEDVGAMILRCAEPRPENRTATSGRFSVTKVVPELADHIIACGLPVKNLHERKPPFRSASKASVCLFTEPQKFSFREFLRYQSFREQRVEFIRCPRKAWHSALFDGGQGSLNHLLNGLVCTATHDGLNPPLLFRCEMNCHGVRPLVRLHTRVRENRPAATSARQEASSSWPCCHSR
jgi:hypothetical protein